MFERFPGLWTAHPSGTLDSVADAVKAEWIAYDEMRTEEEHRMRVALAGVPRLA